MNQREQLASRLGFLLLSAGCAIGLGNVWRFPYITGKYGGAVFLVVYLLFLVFVGLPVLVMEFSVGRATQRNMAHALKMLEPRGTWWHKFGIMSPIGNYLLMMFYIPIAGWMLCYCWFMITGTLLVPSEQVPACWPIPGFFCSGQLLFPLPALPSADRDFSAVWSAWSRS